jgi:hypothetical protein
VSRGREGCDDLLAALDRIGPALHVFGHIHEDGGLWQHGTTTIANVTTWDCTRPATVVDYDPSTRTVTPVAVPPPPRAVAGAARLRTMITGCVTSAMIFIGPRHTGHSSTSSTVGGSTPELPSSSRLDLALLFLPTGKLLIELDGERTELVECLGRGRV